MVKIHAPAKKEIKDYGLGKITDVTINGEAVIPILADKIYKSPYSAIRELYVNEVTAVKKALRINPNLSPEIHISIDTNTREMTIKGIDSLGIDTDTFKHILAVMGNSGNNKGDETGYYGLGFYSFVKISERIIINSYSLESGEKWACIAKSALKFEELPKNSYKPLNKTGFEIKLTIKNELDISLITQKIEEISMLSGVKTTLHIDEVFQELKQYDNLEHYFKSHYNEYFNNNSSYSLMYEHINNDDYELIIGYKSGNDVYGIKKSFLINVPINLEFSREAPIMLLNVKNERKFKPSADRERFDENDEDILIDIINSHSFEPKDRIKPIKTLHELYESKYRFFYEEVNGLSLYMQVKDLKNRDYYDRYRASYIKDELPIKEPIEFRISKTLRKKSFKDYEAKNIYAVQVWDQHKDYKNFIKMGFIDIDSGKKKPKKRSGCRTTKRTKNFKFHNRYGQTYDKSDIDSDDIIIRVDNVKDTSIRHRLYDGMYLITKNADYDNDVTIEELPTLLDNNKIYATNKGFLTAKHIIKLAERFPLYDNVNSDYEIENDNEDKIMMKLYNFNEHHLIVRFDKSKDSHILRLILGLKYGRIYHDNFDFYNMRQEIENEKYEKWEQSITDIRLQILMQEIDTKYETEYQQVLTSLQESLK